MGCNCGQPMRPWNPAKKDAEEGEQRELTPNERIQQARAASHQVWPGTWQGRNHTPAR